jgi:hypothetical protein
MKAIRADARFRPPNLRRNSGKEAKWRAKKVPFGLDPKLAPFLEEAYKFTRDTISKQVFGL